MKIKLWYFLAGYIIFYLVINFSFSLPNEYDGKSIDILLRNSSRGYWWRMMDIGLWFVLTLVPYLTLVWLFPQKKLYCFLLFFIGITTSYLFRFYIDRSIANRPISLHVHLIKNSYFLISFALYPVVFFFIRYSQTKALQAKELLLQNRQAELSFLRSQINPHFLFNSLNNIYSLVFAGSAQALPAIAGFSDILRYTIYDASENIYLDKEIAFIEKYIALQKLRYEHPLNINLQVEGPVSEISCTPLLFFPFVENAFKHGEPPEMNEELLISIIAAKNKTFFHCRNKKSRNQKDPAKGIGLENVKRRLQLLYPSKHALNIEDKDGYFDVTLDLEHEN